MSLVVSLGGDMAHALAQDLSGSSADPSTDLLLLEDNFFFLLEDGDKLLLG